MWHWQDTAFIVLGVLYFTMTMGAGLAEMFKKRIKEKIMKCNLFVPTGEKRAAKKGEWVRDEHGAIFQMKGTYSSTFEIGILLAVEVPKEAHSGRLGFWDQRGFLISNRGFCFPISQPKPITGEAYLYTSPGCVGCIRKTTENPCDRCQNKDKPIPIRYEEIREG